jgi:hypothetical protein
MSERDTDWILAMGHALGLDSGFSVPRQLFEAIRAAERERCARVCETLYEDGPRGSDQDSFATCQECAAAIRSGNASDL